MNPVQRPLENVLKHPPIIMDLAVSMSLPSSPSPTPTSTTPPRIKSSNRPLPSSLGPNSPLQQPSTSPRSTASPGLPTSPRHVSGNASSPATPPPERSKTRARDLLRRHYGLNVTPPPPSGRPMDPMDLGNSPLGNRCCNTKMTIDSPAFDAKAYYDQLITTASLTTLLKKENELLTGESSVQSHSSNITDFPSRNEAVGWRTSILGL